MNDSFNKNGKCFGFKQFGNFMNKFPKLGKQNIDQNTTNEFKYGKLIKNAKCDMNDIIVAYKLYG